MTIEEKIIELNLLRLTTKMVEYLCEIDPFTFNFELDVFEFVTFHKTKPYFYSLSYIEDNNIEFLKKEFDNIKNL